MKVRATRSFIDKYSMKSIPKGTEFDVTDERFSELTAGPRGIFVEEIKEEPPAPLPEKSDKDDNKLDEPPQEHEVKPVEELSIEGNGKPIAFDKLTKNEIVEYAKRKGIELDMKSKKEEMIEILLKK